MHVHNVDALLATFAPFHVTPQFSRLVQLCRLEGTQWSMLEQMRSTGATLPRAALVQACTKRQVRRVYAVTQPHPSDEAMA